ncbi:MAG TPA: nucleoside deaminase [Gemmatimonas aurantiaca]|nr:nucleoside deaminase [Gemmatimonas aurantiaca]HCT56135.1 nucleoside deaminase [Gemmatimonas aurantiaca]
MSTTPVSPPVEFAMRQALQEAEQAAAAGEVPVGAVVMRTETGEIIVRAQNRMRRDGDATAHAEVLALREAARIAGDARLGEFTLVVTLEPCAMCAGAIVLARIGALAFGAWDEKAGMCGSVGDIVRHARLNHRPAVQGGVLESENRALLQQFFAERR